MSNPLAPGDRALVNVEIVKKGDGTYGGAHGGGATDEVLIKSTKGDTFWVPEKDVYARKPNPEVTSTLIILETTLDPKAPWARAEATSKAP